MYRDKHRGAVGTNFCIPPTFVPSVDNQEDLGGPGAFSLEGNHQLSTSGAFLDMEPGLLEKDPAVFQVLPDGKGAPRKGAPFYVHGGIDEFSRNTA